MLDPAVAALQGDRIALAIPGEINDGFLSQIAAFRLALRRLPPPYGEARILAFLGAKSATEQVPERWCTALQDVDIRIVTRDPTEGYVPQARARFGIDEPGLDYVFLCDADTLPLGPFDKALSKLLRGAPVVGVVAHGPPPHFRHSDWNALANELTGTPLTFPHRYTIWRPKNPGMAEAIRAPFYLNHGIVGFRADALRIFHEPYLALRAAVEARVDPPAFAGQMALTLTLHHLGLKGAALPMRFNFPNDDRALALYPKEARDVRLLHVLREARFQRATLFADPGAFATFMSARPEGADALVYDALMRLTCGEYPF